MKKIDGFTVRRLGNESMIVAESVDLIDFDRIVSLNPSAAYVWELLPAAGFSTGDIVDLLLRRYDVEEEVARRDAEELLRIWLIAGVVEE